MRRADRLSLALAGFAAFLLAPAAADACTISATGVAFGAYDTLAASPRDGVGSIDLGCPPSSQSPIVSLGAGSSGNVAARTLRNGAWSLNYNLFTTTARNIVWGNGTGGTVTLQLSGGTVNAGTRRFSASIYGRIPARQPVRAGGYSDTIIVTVTY